MPKKIFLFSLICLFYSSQASAYYDFTARVEQAYSSILSFHFTEAETLLAREKSENPENDLVLLYYNYIDFLKAFITEEKPAFETLKKNSAWRLEYVNNNKLNSTSPFHLYMQAEILVQQALVRLKFEENIISAGEIRRAFKLIEKNERKFPSFILNKKIAGFLHAIVGSVPPKFQWVVKVAGMNGTIHQGLEELKYAYEKIETTSFSIYRTEIIFYLGNIYSIFSTEDSSIPLIQLMQPLVSQSPLISYIYVNILMKHGKNEEAFIALNTTLKDHTAFPFYYLYYKRGISQLRKLNLSAERDLWFYLNHYHGENSIKSAYQKLGWIALLKGDTAHYFSYMRQCRVTGNDLLDEDKDGLHESSLGEIPNIYLLRSRLYFDGGYYTKALSEISGKSINDFPRFRDQLEVTYRLGRIMQMTGQKEKAIEYFESTLKNGAAANYHFAANSSLMLATIFEGNLMFDKAKLYYQKCLTLEYDQYKNSIDQKAQAGLDRIKSRKQ